MNDKRKLLDIRNTQWQALCEKYEKRGEINTADCSFGEVNYKMFAKTKLIKPKRKIGRKTKKKFIKKPVPKRNNTVRNPQTTLDVDISDIIDDDVYEILPEEHSRANNSKSLSIKSLKENNRVFTPIKHDEENEDQEVLFCKDGYVSIFDNWPATDVSENDKSKNSLNENNNSSQNYMPVEINKEHKVKCQSDKENCDTNTPTSLADLVHFIEIDLRSPLKELTATRGESKILETDDYSYWHDRTKKEMKRLRKYISRDELKEYMRYCNQDVNLNLVHNQISTSAKNNLKELLIKREFSRGNEEKYLKYSNRIYEEWKKLVVEIPTEHITLYASCIINSLKERKQICSSVQKKSQKVDTMDLLKESVDSGFVTV